MPSSRKAREAIASLIPISQGNICDLGSGWGSLVGPLARKYPHIEWRGYEISPLPWAISCLVNFVKKNVGIKREDFFSAPLNESDGVICFLYPKAMHRLKEKFEKELRPGTFVISNAFSIPGWKPTRVIELDDFWHSKVYLYFFLEG